MSVRMSAVGLLATLALGSTSQAQIQQPQVVQLPTFSFFTVSTTVSVPDRGRAFLGGVQRRRSSSASRGLPWISGLPAASRLARSRALASEASSSGASATATIMDLKEIDDALLRGAATRPELARRESREIDRKALRLARNIGGGDVDLKLGSSADSVAAIRRQNSAADVRRDAELMTHWDNARAAESAGLLGAARCSYQLLARRSTGKLHKAALARLEALSQQSSVARPQ